ncbi:hypothetical protein [Cupriavidus sp. AU9028]|uniref:hypothetical protein n=1 Tax=Cupriavidus sp. AU9028 TaxID=2871157 RepID=UPI001C965973|nr:hypothetical protein [Cupriavidus sp. AU9028]MBY4897524.1 hypothetical protein [Cupriavidus sp. AU9028]
MWEELENALAWFKSAPAGWVESGKQNLSAAAEWIWVVIQGDFADEQSTAQVATGTVLSMIPFVDQLCDVRDVVANCRKINDDTNDKWAWVALVLTLIGLFPVLGSLAKGCCKILFAYGRKSVFRAGKAALDSSFWKASEPFVEAGIKTLNRHLQNPTVRRALRAANIVNPYRWLSTQVRAVVARLNAGELSRAFDSVIEGLRYFVDLIGRWGNAAMQTRAGQLLGVVLRVRGMMASKLDEVLGPVNAWLHQLARRLEIEGDTLHRANVDAVNPHKYQSLGPEDELPLLSSPSPTWVDDTGILKFEELNERVSPVEGWPELRAYRTFHAAQPTTVKAGEVLYRVVDPNSKDNGAFWMREHEFLKVTDRADWRRRFAVWRHWNRNGEFVTYTVPPGTELRAWEGPAASQALRGSPNLVLEGGGNQLVVDPTLLQPEFLSRRQLTGWGYTDFPGETDEFLGLPKLTNNLNMDALPSHHPMRPKQ